MCTRVAQYAGTDPCHVIAATADADATLSESTARAMGIRTRKVHDRIASGVSPSPSAPRTSAMRRGPVIAQPTPAMSIALTPDAEPLFLTVAGDGKLEV